MISLFSADAKDAVETIVSFDEWRSDPGVRIIGKYFSSNRESHPTLVLSQKMCIDIKLHLNVWPPELLNVSEQIIQDTFPAVHEKLTKIVLFHKNFP